MDTLFIARDLSVNEIAVRRIGSEKVIANAEKTAKNFPGYKKLPDLLEGSITRFTEQERYYYKSFFEIARDKEGMER